MASSLALKRLLSSSTISSSASRLLRPLAAPSSTASRFFNTNAGRDFHGHDDDADERGLDAHRRGSVPRPRGADLLSDVFDPFSRTRSLSQVLNMMDQLMDNPFLSSTIHSSPTHSRAWDARETEDALHLRIDLPGLGKEDVKVSVEYNTLIIKGDMNDDENAGRKYSSRIDLPEKIFKLDEIKAEMKNGVLRVVVPKVKEDERTDVFHVNVQ